tara:strand:- start:2583 stop:3089 length:507 start_codon:yes stop_codon:yes gene_type:complete
MDNTELDKITYALTILKKSNSLKQSIQIYCIDLEDNYNDKELELITKCVQECIDNIKNLILEIKNKQFNSNDIYVGIMALQTLTNCYNLITGYIQEDYSNYNHTDKSLKKKNICNLIIYLSICFGSEDPYDDLLKKIWKEQGNQIIEGIMIVKNWTKNTIKNVSKCCF